MPGLQVKVLETRREFGDLERGQGPSSGWVSSVLDPGALFPLLTRVLCFLSAVAS